VQQRICDPYSFCLSDDIITTIEQARTRLLLIFTDIYMQYAYGQFEPYYMLVINGGNKTNSTSGGKRDDEEVDQVDDPSANPNYGMLNGMGLFVLFFEIWFFFFPRTNASFLISHYVLIFICAYSSVVFENPYCNTSELNNATATLLSQSIFFLVLPAEWIQGRATYLNNTNINNSYLYDGMNCTIIIDLSGCFPARYYCENVVLDCHFFTRFFFFFFLILFFSCPFVLPLFSSCSYIGIAVGIPVGLLFLLTFIAIVVYLVRRWLLKKSLKVVKNLPRECTVHYRDCIKHPDDWEQIETDPPTWRKELTRDDDKDYVLDCMDLILYCFIC
jgi:hypothetical protein